MKWINKLFNFVLFYQLILFFFFLLENYTNLDEIEIMIDVNNEQNTITINLYTVLIGLGVIYTLLIAIGIQVVGSGLSDSALNTLGTFVRLSVIYSVLLFSTTFYLQFLFQLGVIIQIFIFAIYLFKGFNDIGEYKENN